MTLSPATAQTTDPELLRTFEINQMGEITPNVSVDYSALGTPAFVRSTTAYLTRRLDAAPLDIVAAFVNDNPALFGVPFPEEGANGYRVIRNYVTSTLGPTGVRHITLRQRHSGQDVFGGLLTANVTGDGMLVNIGSTFHEVGNGLASPPTCGARDAISAACAHMNDDRTNDFLALVPENTECLTDWKVGQLLNEAGLYVKSVWYPTSATTIVQAWDVRIPSNGEGSAWQVVIAHGTGAMLLSQDQMFHSCEPDPVTYSVYRDDSPVPATPGLDDPSDSGVDSECEMRAQVPVPDCPNQIGDGRELTTVQVADMQPGSPNGWINDRPAGANGYAHCLTMHSGAITQTCGNNVRVVGPSNTTYLASNRDFTPGGVNLPQPLSEVHDAAVVQAFFVVNEWHDRLCVLGFDEASGNYQQTNYAGFGLGNDPLRVRVNQEGLGQYGTTDTSGLIREDGTDGAILSLQYMRPVGQTFHQLAAALDRTVILHELTHAMEARLLVGFAARGIPSSGASEGWADYFAIALTAKPGDDFDAPYPVFCYPARKMETDRNQYYFGPRMYPYSTDLAINPVTFGFVRSTTSPCQPVVHEYVEPRNPNVSVTRTDKYRIGEVWASALLECRAELAPHLGFAANEVVLQLVVDGMKLSPPVPNLLQARDAVLEADLIRHGGTHQYALWEAFARRGLGFDAISPPGDATLVSSPRADDVCESFALPPANEVSVFLPDDVPLTIETCRPTHFEVHAVCPNGTLTNVRANASPEPGSLGLPANATLISPGRYRVTLAAAPCRQSWEVWIETTVGTTMQTWPPLWLAAGESDSWIDTMETSMGWSGSFTGAGAWTRIDPWAGPIQPGRDTTPTGTFAWITENHLPASNNDADDVDTPSPGVVLTSPALPVASGTDAIIEFRMWYASMGAQAADREVEVEWVRQAGATESTANRGHFVPSEAALRWQRRRVQASTGTTTGVDSKIRFRFVDVPPNTTLEGGIDDVRVVWITGCEECCDGDYDQNGVFDQDDVALLIDVIAGSPNPYGVDPDFNSDGVSDQIDIIDLINYGGGAGCP